MPLNPQTKSLLDRLAADPAPPLDQQSPGKVRREFEAFVEAFDVKDVPIGRVEERTIPGPAGELRVRLYTPVDAAGAVLPALIYFHGGGYVLGSLDTADATCRQLANAAGVRVISVDYRLAPENRFPAAVEDAFAAVGAVTARAQELDVDPDRIAVGGDSAGATLAAVAAHMARDAGGPGLAFQLLLYPLVDFAIETPSKKDFAIGYRLDEARLRWFRGHYFRSAAELDDFRLSPLRAADFRGLPPALVVTAGYDPLCDEGRLYAERMQQADVPVIHRRYPGQIHGFMICGGVIDEARTALTAAGADLKAALQAL